MAGPGGEQAHTPERRAASGTALRSLKRRCTGAVRLLASPAAGVDLRHQTLAVRPETRRGSAETGGRVRPPWRSGARRPDSSAGREPKGASALLVVVLPFFCRQQLLNNRNRNRNRNRNSRKSKRSGRKKKSGRRRRGSSGSAAGASAFPGPRRGLPVFFGRAGEQGLSTAPALPDRKPSVVQTSVDPTHCAPR